MKINGEVFFVGETIEVGTSNKLLKRELILLTGKDEEYQNHISIGAIGGKTPIFDGLNVGDDVSIDYNLRGRIYQAVNKPVSAINELSAWRVEVTRKSANAPAPEQQTDGTLVVDNGVPTTANAAAEKSKVPF